MTRYMFTLLNALENKEHLKDSIPDNMEYLKANWSNPGAERPAAVVHEL